jgi:hypothetical protein
MIAHVLDTMDIFPRASGGTGFDRRLIIARFGTPTDG